MKNIQDINSVFAERLFDLIHERGWSIAEFSNQVRIPRTTINSWLLKLKSPRIDSLYEISDFFGVTIDYLVGRED